MAWKSSNWLVLTRIFQLVAALAAGSLNGFLVAWVYIKKLGLANNMVILEIMICAVLVYITLALIGVRSKRTGWLVCFLICDVVFSGVDIGLITVLARAGVPTHCAGLTRSDFEPKDSPQAPRPGYSTIRFSNEAGGAKGELDRFCAFERSFYFIAIGLIFTFMISIVLTVLTLCERHYTRNTRVTELLNSLERNAEKEQEQYSPLLSTPTAFAPPPPASEGIITRQTSIRSVITAPRTPVPNPYRAAPIIPRPIIPRRPLPTRTSTTLSAISSHNDDSPVSPLSRHDLHDDQYGDAADAALVADGMQHRPQQQPHRHSYYAYNATPEPGQHSMPMLREEEDDNFEAALVSDGMRHSGPRNMLHSSYQQQHEQQDIQKPIMPISIHDEESAALVSDGMRPSSALPPYTPGRSQMTGHAEEGNEMRLSEYVKGETRAQEMKDTGRFM